MMCVYAVLCLGVGGGGGTFVSPWGCCCPPEICEPMNF